MKKTQLISYNKILNETNKSRDIHNELIESVTIGRWRLEDEVDYLIETGRIYSPLLIAEAIKTRDNLYILKGYDTYLEEELTNSKYCNYKGALKN